MVSAHRTPSISASAKTFAAVPGQMALFGNPPVGRTAFAIRAAGRFVRRRLRREGRPAPVFVTPVPPKILVAVDQAITMARRFGKRGLGNEPRFPQVLGFRN